MNAVCELNADRADELKPSGHYQANERYRLNELADQIKHRESLIQELRENGKALQVAFQNDGDKIARRLLSVILEQGRELLRAKTMVERLGDEWLAWLEVNFGKSKSTAYRWMELAKEQNFPRVGNATSLREALSLCNGAKPTKQDELETFPELLMKAFRKACKVSTMKKDPVAALNEDQKFELRDKLQPVVNGLWPELRGGAS